MDASILQETSHSRESEFTSLSWVWEREWLVAGPGPCPKFLPVQRWPGGAGKSQVGKSHLQDVEPKGKACKSRSSAEAVAGVGE